MNDVVFNYLTSVDFCYSSDPTHDYSLLVAANVNPMDNFDVTVLASNCTTTHHAGAMLINHHTRWPTQVQLPYSSWTAHLLKINDQPCIQFKQVSQMGEKIHPLTFVTSPFQDCQSH